MVRKVNVDEREHALIMLRRLNQMKQDQCRCDFVVSVDGELYHTHRNILSAGSDYFDAMLTHDTKENQLGMVEMKDVDPECVKICIDYIYTGKADISEGKVEQLMHIASMMQLSMLCDGIAEILEADLSPSTYYSTKQIAETYRCENLLSSCSKYKKSHYFQISAQKEFLAESKEDVFTVLTSDFILSDSERLIIALRWIGQDPDKGNFLSELIEKINLDDVSVDYRRHLMENHPLVRDDFSMFKILALSVFDTTNVVDLNISDFFMKKSIVVFEGDSKTLLHFNLDKDVTSPMHKARIPNHSFFSAAYLSSCLYILNGDKEVHKLEFTCQNAAWKRMEDMRHGHGSRPPVAVMSGKLYVIGGHHGCYTDAAERYQPEDDCWEELDNRPGSISKASLVGLNGFIYSIGGSMVDQDYIQTFSRLNPQNSEWTDLEPMKSPKRNCGTVAVNYNIFVAGGFNGEYCQDFECYDTVSAQWSSLPNMTKPRSILKLFHADGLLFAVGGNESKSKSIEAYDIKKNEWTEMKSIWKSKHVYEAVIYNEDC